MDFNEQISTPEKTGTKESLRDNSETQATETTKTVVDHDELPVGLPSQIQVPEVEMTQPNPDGFFADTSNQAACSVRVAVRVRPLINKEQFDKQCVRVYDKTNQIQLDREERTFNYDACFASSCTQEEIFEKCAKNLVLGCFDGYNATILAYGQTGSGKTWTMGSGYTNHLHEDQFGIIPRVIDLIFNEKEKRKHKTDIIVKCSFLEIYKEELFDLLDPSIMTKVMEGGEKKSNVDKIKEDKNGTISIVGLREEKVDSGAEMTEFLVKGGDSRTTAYTKMNDNSSRSHAIFTITIEQHQIDDLYQVADGVSKEEAKAAAENEYMMAKFHFVDLAGCEQAKKTGATGDTLKEAIKINMSLTTLGKVIQALSEEGKKNHHIPYRESKLTRILQDSLGGNSKTTMIACVSPSEANYAETLSTLHYAARARKIQCKPIVNRDPNSQLIADLRQQVFELQTECVSFKKLLVTNQIEFKENLTLPSEEQIASSKQSGSPIKQMVAPTSGFNISGQEIRALENEIKQLKVEVIKKEKECQASQVLNQELQSQLSTQQYEVMTAQQQKDEVRLQIDQINQILDKLGYKDQVSTELTRMMAEKGEENEEFKIFGSGPTLLQEYQKQVQELRKEADDKQLIVSQLQNECDCLLKQQEDDKKVLEKQQLDIEKYKVRMAQLQKESASLSNDVRNLQKQVKQGGSEKQGPASRVGSAARTNSRQSAQAPVSAPFRSSFAPRRVNTMSAGQGQTEKRGTSQDLDFLSKAMEDQIASLNSKYIESLSNSLSAQLGYDWSEAAGDKARMSQSIVLSQSDAAKGSPIKLQPVKNRNFDLDGGKNSGLSQSVLLPPTPKGKSGEDHKDAFAKGTKLSIIEDTKTVNEDDELSDFSAERVKLIEQNLEAVPSLDAFHQQSFKTEQAGELHGDLMDSIMKRASTLKQAEEENAVKRSQLQATDSLINEKDDAPVVLECDDEDFDDSVPIQVDLDDGQEKDETEDDLMVEVIQKEINNEEKQQELRRQSQQSVIVKLDGEKMEKEKILTAIKEQQNQMQKELIDLMKHQYQQKVQQLTDEMSKLEVAKTTTMKSKGGVSDGEKRKIEDQFKAKQKDLERQLNAAKAKEKEQQQVKKKVDTQVSKIKNLEGEISKIRVQKVTFQRKFKEENDKHNKLKKAKADEILRLKKGALKKDKEIDRLRKEAKRKQIVLIRKQEENKMLQSRQNLVNNKKSNAQKMRKEKAKIDVEKIKNWIRQSVENMMQITENQQQIQSQQEKLETVQEEIDGELNNKASLQVQMEKLNVTKYEIEGMPAEQQDQEKLFEVEQDIEKLELEIDHYQQTIEDLTQRQFYIHSQISELRNAVIGITSGMQGQLADQDMKSPEGVKALIDSFFHILQEATMELRQAQTEHEKEIIRSGDLREELDQLKNQTEVNEKFFQQQIKNLENECHLKEMELEQINQTDEEKKPQEHHTQNINQKSKKEELEKKKEQYLNETKTQLSKKVDELMSQNKELDMQKRKIQNQLNIAISDKEHLKKQNENYKHQLKSITAENEAPQSQNQQSLEAQKFTIGEAMQAFAGGLRGTKPQTTRVPTYAERRELFKAKKNSVGLQDKIKPFDGNESKKPQIDVDLADEDNEGKSHEADEVEQAIKSPPQNKAMSALEDQDIVLDKDEKKGIMKKIASNASLQNLKHQSKQLSEGANPLKKHNFNPTKRAQAPEKGVFDRLAGGPQNGLKRPLTTKGFEPLQQPRKPSTTLHIKPSVKLAQAASQASLGAQKEKKQRQPAALNFNTGAITHSIKSSRDHYKPDQSSELYPTQKKSAQKSRNSEANSPLVRDELDDESSPWCIDQVLDNAHSHPINAITTVGNQMYTASLKKIKVWDVTTFEKISEIPAHNGAVTCVKAASNGQMIFATAGDLNDKCVHIWDMVTFTNMSTLVGHQGQVRAIEFAKDGLHLFSAGQGGMLVWDLRNTKAPLEKIERQQDIHALRACKSHLFMGCKSSEIIPMRTGGPKFSEHIMSPFKASHTNAVTSFASLNNDSILVSASRDKSLKCWRTKTYQNDFLKLENLSKKDAHLDQISVIDSNMAQDELYSGSKDGTVNVWKLDIPDTLEANLNLQKVSTLQGNGGAVTALSSVEDSYGKLFVFACQDKGIRVCKSTEFQENVLNFHEEEQKMEVLQSKSVSKSGKKMNLKLNLDDIAQNQCD